MNKKSDAVQSSLLKFEIDNLNERGFHYDGSRDIGYGGYRPLPKKWDKFSREIVDSFLLEESSKLLDIGCAKGYFVEALVKLGIKNVWGTDISKYAIQSAPISIRDKLFLQNGLRLPFPDKYFDFVFCIDTIQEIPLEDLDSFLTELIRVTKKFIGYSSSNDDSIEKYKNWSILSELQQKMNGARCFKNVDTDPM